jgi:hypothetical protein
MMLQRGHEPGRQRRRVTGTTEEAQHGKGNTALSGTGLDVKYKSGKGRGTGAQLTKEQTF